MFHIVRTPYWADCALLLHRLEREPFAPMLSVTTKSATTLGDRCLAARK
jgi:hypothetical protein